MHVLKTTRLPDLATTGKLDVSAYAYMYINIVHLLIHMYMRTYIRTHKGMGVEVISECDKSTTAPCMCFCLGRARL